MDSGDSIWATFSARSLRETLRHLVGAEEGYSSIMKRERFLNLTEVRDQDAISDVGHHGQS
jgi:hypothetical protein